MANSRKRLAWLVGVHVAAGLVCALTVTVGPPNVPALLFIVSVFSQAGLLGLWGALAAVLRPLRCLAVTVGLVYLGAVAAAVTGREAWIFALLLLATCGAVFLAGFVVRLCGAQLRRLGGGASAVSEGLQFSIRDLMVLTACVGVLLALTKYLQPGRQEDLIAILAIFSLSFTVGPLVALWASLGLGRIAIRVPIALCIAVTPGLVPMLVRGGPPHDPWFWPTVTLLQGAITIGSLLVARSCGYRLVRGPRRGAANVEPDAEPIVADAGSPPAGHFAEDVEQRV